jgi:hypothetical protein
VSGRRISSPTPKRLRTSNETTGSSQHFAICVRNDDYPASLELRKLYRVLADSFADEHDMIRIVDESGEDYLFPDSYFVRVELPRAVEQVLQKIA